MMIFLIICFHKHFIEKLRNMGLIIFHKLSFDVYIINIGDKIFLDICMGTVNINDRVASCSSYYRKLKFGQYSKNYISFHNFRYVSMYNILFIFHTNFDHPNTNVIWIKIIKICLDLF